MTEDKETDEEVGQAISKLLDMEMPTKTDLIKMRLYDLTTVLLVTLILGVIFATVFTPLINSLGVTWYFGQSVLLFVAFRMIK